jgi:hypothetical protein
VRGKTFAWLDKSEAAQHDGEAAGQPRLRLVFDFAEPAGYGLGRSAGSAAAFPPARKADLDLMKRWIAESYRAVAPKKLAAQLPED